MIRTILNYLGIYKAPKKFKRILNMVDSSDLLLDIGANVGFYSMLMAKTGAQTISYEPNPFAFKELEKVGLSQKNLTIINKAVSNKNQKAKLFLHENHNDNPVKWSSGSSLDERKANVTETFVETDIVDIADILNKNYFKIIKIDVEGAEIEILNRIFEMNLTNKFEHMFVEMHDHKMPHLTDPSNELRDFIKTNNFNNIHLDWH